MVFKRLFEKLRNSCTKTSNTKVIHIVTRISIQKNIVYQISLCLSKCALIKPNSLSYNLYKVNLNLFLDTESFSVAQPRFELVISLPQCFLSAKQKYTIMPG